MIGRMQSTMIPMPMLAPLGTKPACKHAALISAQGFVGGHFLRAPIGHAQVDLEQVGRAGPAQGHYKVYRALKVWP